MISAQRAAKSRPRSDAPAWMKTGRPCGERLTLSGPRTLNHRPRWSIGRTRSGSAKSGVSTSRTRASSRQLSQSFEKFVRPVVALVARELVLKPEIGSLRLLERGDDVPGGATAAQMIERRHGAGDREGMEIRRRYRARQAEIFCRRRHRRKHYHGIEPQRAESAVAQLAVELVFVSVRNRQNVCEENEVEAAVFEDAADIAVIIQRQKVAVGRRVAPPAVMAGNRSGH